MFPLSNSSFWSFPYGHRVAADVLFLSFCPLYLSLYNISSSIFPSKTWFTEQFLRKMWPIYLALLSLYAGCPILRWQHVIFFHLLHDLSNKLLHPYPKPLFKIFFSTNTVRAPHSESVKYILYLHNLLIVYLVIIPHFKSTSLKDFQQIVYAYFISPRRVWHPTYPILLWISPT
jgi:hypothetical protein